MTSLGTFLYTLICGKCVGTDNYGNRYYQSRTNQANSKPKRWVVYKGQVEASKVPPLWSRWLHYTTDAVPPKEVSNYSWQKPHQPNLTGTQNAYFPPGHIRMGGKRQKATGDYQPWQG